MSEMPTPPELSPDERRLVELAVVVQKTLRDERRPSSAWAKDLLNSSLAATLVTVILGGWVGNCIVADYQQRAKDREREITDHKDRIQRQITTVTSAYDLLGEADYYANTLVALTTAPYQVFNVRGADVAKLQSQRDAMIDAANGFLLKWEKEKFTVGALLAYYARNPKSVLARWHAASAAADVLLQAAQREYGRYLANPKEAYAASIATEERAFRAAIDNLVTTLTPDYVDPPSAAIAVDAASATTSRKP